MINPISLAEKPAVQTLANRGFLRHFFSPAVYPIQSIICGIHFSILVYIVLAERKMMLAFLGGLFVEKK